MDDALAAARLYAAGVLVLGIDRFSGGLAHAVAGLSGLLATALFVGGSLLQPAVRRPFLRLSAVASAVGGGAAVYELLGQHRDPAVFSWLAAPMVMIGLQAGLAAYLQARDSARPPVAARLMLEMIFSFAVAVGINSGQAGFTLGRAASQMLAILSLLGVVSLATNTPASLAPIFAMQRGMLCVLLVVMATRHVIGDTGRAHSPELFPLAATACVALLIAPISLK